jgi:DNA (cytosine-5)-methyltransferase 1
MNNTVVHRYTTSTAIINLCKTITKQTIPKKTIIINDDEIERRPIMIATDCSGIDSPIAALQKLNIEYEHLWSCDINHHCRKIILDNHKPQFFFDNLLDTRIRHSYFPPLGVLDLYIVGVPCIPYSVCALHKTKRQRKKKIDENTVLFDAVFDTIRETRPKIVILENVPGLMNQLDFLRIIVLLKEWEYEIHYSLLNSMNYGIPQRRKRLYIVGIHNTTLKKNMKFQFPPPPSTTTLSLSDIIEKAKQYEDDDEDVDETTTTHVNPCMQRMLDAVRDDMQRYTFINLSDGARRKHRLPSSCDVVPCLTSQCRYLYCVPEKRFITINELLLLQGFDPSRFKKTVSKNQMAKQIGNTMTVNVVAAILRCVFDYVSFV